MIDFLKDIGAFENAVVYDLSDNGPNPWISKDYAGNRGGAFLERFDNSPENTGHPNSNHAYGIGWASASSRPFDRFKTTVEEGGIRSPPIVAGPGARSGARTDEFAYVTDIMPTILDFADVERPEQRDGRRLEPMSGRALTGSPPTSRRMPEATRSTCSARRSTENGRGGARSRRCPRRRPAVPGNGSSTVLKRIRARRTTLRTNGRNCCPISWRPWRRMPNASGSFSPRTSRRAGRRDARPACATLRSLAPKAA